MLMTSFTTGSKMAEEQKEYVLCVLVGGRHILESVLGKCSKCQREVWVSPWNSKKTLICLDCAAALPDDVKISINKKDLMRAKEEIDGFK